MFKRKYVQVIQGVMLILNYDAYHDNLDYYN